MIQNTHFQIESILMLLIRIIVFLLQAYSTDPCCLAIILVIKQLSLFLNKMASTIPSIRYQNQIDQHLKNQFHEICFNPAKKEMLERLTKIDSQQHDETYHEQSFEKLDNNIIRRYIKEVYDKYGIEDPIKRQFRLAQRNHSLNTDHSPEKSMQATQFTETDRLTRTKKKLIDLKNSFQRQSQDIISSSKATTNQRLSENSNYRSRIGREIGYRTKQKIFFKGKKGDDRILPISQQIVKHQYVIEKPGQPRFIIKFNNPQQSVKSKKTEIPVVFRYCPMCEEPILEYNIQHHEIKCIGLQKAYSISYTQMEKIIYQKIKRMEKEIRQNFLQKEEKHILQQYRQLRKSMQIWVREGNRQQFHQIRSQFEEFTLKTFEKITKLNWFRNLRNNLLRLIKKQGPK